MRYIDSLVWTGRDWYGDEVARGHGFDRDFLSVTFEVLV